MNGVVKSVLFLIGFLKSDKCLCYSLDLKLGVFGYIKPDLKFH